MTYITTKVQTLKSYPTYQFSAYADSAAADTNGVFRICILEAMRWIRSRLSDQTELPEGINTPEPQDHAQFSDDSIVSFSYEGGFQMEAVFIEELGIWSFRIVEPDPGANLGTERERQPVNGRTFTTEIAFRKLSDRVAVGIRTICSQPSDVQKDCEVFRPRIVRALDENPYIRLMHSGFILNGEPLRVTSRSEFERFISIYEDAERSLPLIVFADTSREVKLPAAEDITADMSALNLSRYKLSRKNDIEEQRISIAPELLPFKAGEKAELTVKKQKTKPAADKAARDPVAEKLPMLDYTRLARRLLGYAIVVFVEEGFFRQTEIRTQLSLKHGDIVTIQGRQMTDRMKYPQYGRDMQTAFDELYAAAVEMPKRSAFQYGEAVFCSEAKQKEYHAKRKKTSSLEERCELYRLERDSLNKQVRELKQQQNDMAQNTAEIRALQKKTDALERDLADKTEECSDLKNTLAAKEDSYRRSSGLIQFYQQLYELAASFPRNKNDVCSWIENSFSDELTVTPRAAAEMRKYSGALDLFSLCDGVVYLSAYARYRKQEITAEELALYAVYGKWDIQGCGKEALRMFRTDYTVSCGGRQYILDLHIKHGRQAEELIRIYFCWDEENKKIIIGSMPEHLPTVKNVT